MKRIECVEGRAPKLRGNGTVVYSLWVHECGDLYVRIEENDTVVRKRKGTHNKLLYRVADYADRSSSPAKTWSLKGLDPETFKPVKPRKDNDVAGMLKAVILQLIAEN